MRSTLRADAQRNLGRVLEAAAEVFAERGPDGERRRDRPPRRRRARHGLPPLPDEGRPPPGRAPRPARRGGGARRARRSRRDDPGAAFTDFVWSLMEIHARDRGLYECYDRCPDEQETQEVEALTQRARPARSERGRGAERHPPGRRPEADRRSDPVGTARAVAALRRGRTRRPAAAREVSTGPLVGASVGRGARAASEFPAASSVAPHPGCREAHRRPARHRQGDARSARLVTTLARITTPADLSERC